jgi:hypothetical protein
LIKYGLYQNQITQYDGGVASKQSSTMDNKRGKKKLSRKGVTQKQGNITRSKEHPPKKKGIKKSNIS